MENEIEEAKKRKHEEVEEEKPRKNGIIKEEDCVSKKSKKKRKLLELPPSLEYDLEDLFSNNGKRRGGTHLHFTDLRTLIMLTVHGERFQQLPTWCRVNNWRKLKKTLVLQISGISEEDYKNNKKYFKNLHSHFTAPVIPMRNEGNDNALKSPTQSLLFYRMPKKLMSEKEQMRNEQVVSIEDNGPLSGFLLTEERLVANDFPPWNSAAADHGIITTRCDGEKQPVTDSSEMFAIDCEMCEVRNGQDKVVTRISVINSNLETVYDTYVKPDEVITDYLTKYSGITPDLLEDVKTRLKHVHKKLLELIKPNSILVGHSLDFDLRALKLHHDHVIDTSELYLDHRGPRFKPALRFITNTYLKRNIQTSKKGHCSVEDAKACMELVQLKLKNGVEFGDKLLENESIFDAVTRAGRHGALLESKKIISQHACEHPIPCSNDQEVVDGIKRVTEKVHYVFGHLKGYSNELKEIKEGVLPKQSRKKTMKQIDLHINEIMEALPSECLAIISFTSGHLPTNIVEMMRDKEERKKDVVKNQLRVAKHGVCFVKIT